MFNPVNTSKKPNICQHSWLALLDRGVNIQLDYLIENGMIVIKCSLSGGRIIQISRGITIKR